LAILLAPAFADVALVSDVSDIDDLLDHVRQRGATLDNVALHLVVGIFTLQVGITEVADVSLWLLLVFGADVGKKIIQAGSDQRKLLS